MSIASVDEITKHHLAAWLIWLAVAIALGLYAGRERWWELSLKRREDPLVSLRLLLTAGMTFVVLLALQWFVSDGLRRVPEAIQNGAFTPGATVILSVVCPTGAMIAAWLMVRHRELREAVGLAHDRRSLCVLWGVLGATVAIPIVWFSLQATLIALKELGIEHPEQHRLMEVFTHSEQRWVKIGVIVAAVGVSPVFEELLFRGLIQTSFTRMTGRAWAGILVASALFAGVHERWTQPPIFVLSIMIGVVYTLSGSLWSAILLHALFNTFALIVHGS